MFQSITLAGNLGSDPTMRYTNSGTAVTNFNVATSKRFQGQDGQWQEKTIWFRVTAWGRLAETTSQYLHKGSKVLIVGELDEPETWVNRDGITTATLRLTAQTVRFLSSNGNGNGNGDHAPRPVATPTGTSPEMDVPFGNDELPH